MARLDYKTERRRWEAEQARSAPPTYLDDATEEEHYEPDSSFGYYQTPNHGSGGGSSSFNASNDDMMFSQPQSSNIQTRQSQHPFGFSPLSDAEAEAVLRQENEELEALVEMMESQQLPQYGEHESRQHSQQQSQETGQNAGYGSHPDPCASSVSGSDDGEEYDSIFMDLIDEQVGDEGLAQHQQPSRQYAQQMSRQQHPDAQVFFAVAPDEDIDMS